MSSPVVLLPGLNTTREVWRDVEAEMPKGRPLLLLDCPPLDTVEAVADAITVEAPERFHLVGFSFGGYVALALLQRHPHRLESLVMVSSTASADNEAQRDYRRACLAAAAAGRHEDLNEQGAAMTLHERALQDGALVDRYLTMMRSYGRERYIAHMRACLARPDRTSVLERSQLPMLFVAGEQDRVVSLRRQRQSADAARAELKIIAGAGHQAPLEQPRALAELLSDWLAERD
jgi:pimeloyl-ACP methyl ester carboxylesterase